jgi:CHAT domain-containing protein/tetratricopeptide (TPR) repeat protein
MFWMRRAGLRVPWATPVCAVAGVCLAVACSGAGIGGEDSRDPAQQSAGDTSVATLLTSAEAAYFRSEYDSARLAYEAALSGAHARGDSAGVAEALTWLGLTAWRDGRYADARRLGEEALALKLRLSLRESLFRSYNALGLLADSEGRYADAVELFTRAGDAAVAVGDSTGFGKALGNRGRSYFELGEFEQALNGAETLRRLSRAASDTRSEANALTNIASVAIRLGERQNAVEALKSARVLYAGVDYPVGEENVLAQLGTLFHASGDPHAAIAYLDSAVAVARRHGLRAQESENHQLLAQVFGDLGDHRRALEHLRAARTLTQEHGETGELGAIASAEAQEYLALGSTERARERAREALRVHRESATPLEELRTQLLLADICQRAGNTAESRAALDEARAIAARLDVPLARGLLAVGSARVADAVGDATGVLHALTGRDDDLRRLGSGIEWEAHALRARAHARSGRWAAAVEDGRRAVNAVDQVRGRILAGPLRTTYAEGRAQAYADLVLALLRVNREAEALAVADAARSRPLLEHLGASRQQLTGASARDLGEAERVLRRIDWLVERLQETDTIPERERARRARGVATFASTEAITRELVRARQEYEGLLHRVRAVDPGGAAFFGKVPESDREAGLDVRAVQRALRDDEVMLEFFAGPERLVTFVVTNRELRAVERMTSAEELGVRVRFARDVLNRSEPLTNDGRAALRELHDMLILPAERTGLVAGRSRLIIVPHSSLSHLPFAALVRADGRYLVEEFSVLTLPSAAALRLVRSRTDTSAAERMVVVAPLPDKLPGTKREAATVRRLQPGTIALLGESATKPRVLEALGSAAVVHVASHGVLNELNPMFSRIELSFRRGRSPADNGRLEVHELLGTRIRSHLVYLSGCETAAGAAWTNSFRRGQDYTTLAQAFLYAGAHNVIATLWRIDDEGAAEFADGFYRAAERVEAPEALAAAQRQMLNSKAFSQPRYWAAYTLSGSGELWGIVGERPSARTEQRSVPFRFAGMMRGSDRGSR